MYSEPGHGAVFKIYLPKTDQPVSTARRVTSRPTTLAGTETILLVEDDSALRSFARKALQRHGYKVHEASNGESALAMLASASGSIDLLVTDVVLPGIDGTQLARRMTRDGAAAPVLFMSGYADPIGAPLPFGATMLEKPFTAHELLAAVRQALG